MWYSKIEVGIGRSLKIMQKVKRPKEEEKREKKMVSPGLPCGRQKSNRNLILNDFK